jgi:hypothetical protein
LEKEKSKQKKKPEGVCLTKNFEKKKGKQKRNQK